jgi:hypothetical protein
VCCQDEAASRAQNIEGLWIVGAHLWVWIFDWLDDLSAILAANFHEAILPLARRTYSQ